MSSAPGARPDEAPRDASSLQAEALEPPLPRSKRSVTLVVKKAIQEFMQDQCLDLAAGLTYYAVLALFPALLALVSLLGVFGQGRETVDAVLGLAADVVPPDVLGEIRPVVNQMVNTPAAGFALVAGLLGALWSASGYVGAFSRSMNRVYGIREGRPMWKLRPTLLLFTLVLLLLVAVVMIGLVVSGPVARWIGGLIGLGDAAVTVWGLAKWPVILVIVMLVVGLLYYVTPNVKQPKFRWLSPGAVLAIVVWLAGSLAFGFYVANFGSYNKTYGALAGVVIFLLWLWLTNLALLLGAEVDAESERSRELRAGLPAEDQILLPRRDMTQIDKADAKRDALIDTGRQIRLEAQAAETQDDSRTATAAEGRDRD